MKAKRLYELTIVIGVSDEQDSIEDVKEAVEALIKKSKGTVINEEDWGVKTLAYEIGKFAQGHYIHYRLELSADKTEDFRGLMKHERSLLRWLLVSAEELETQEEA